MDTIYVILRETGEYEQATTTAIRYALTEDAAKAAVSLAEEEAKTKFNLRPVYPPSVPSYRWQVPDGTWLDRFPHGQPNAGAKFNRVPDADAIEAAQETARAEFYRACLAMGCVDPEGPQTDASYSYQAVTAVPQ